ncbi:21685_t:CDS:2 [Gigaspora margarita]|uniref:21685_t:CDS:1 n=1 Tax=Gigaspora margarita TaxID=4874 RepID=A0ABM8VYN3_GIGMA|nr:21685_t:CDS:2 [Gigaspora margarita]
MVKKNLRKELIYDTVNWYNETGSEHSSKHPGHQEVLSEHDKCALVRIANNNHRAPLTMITNEMNLQLGTILTTRTTRNDESRFCLYKSDGRERVWRQVTEKYYRECINTTVKYGGGSIMFWDCFSWWEVGPLVEVKEKYSDEIELIFQQDLAPIHTSAYSEWWMKSHGFDILEWVPYSPDLNPIENLWEHLDLMLYIRRPAPETCEELVMCIKEEWHKMSLDSI